MDGQGNFGEGFSDEVRDAVRGNPLYRDSGVYVNEMSDPDDGGIDPHLIEWERQHPYMLVVSESDESISGINVYDGMRFASIEEARQWLQEHRDEEGIKGRDIGITNVPMGQFKMIQGARAGVHDKIETIMGMIEAWERNHPDEDKKN